MIPGFRHTHFEKMQHLDLQWQTLPDLFDLFGQWLPDTMMLRKKSM